MIEFFPAVAVLAGIAGLFAFFSTSAKATPKAPAVVATLDTLYKKHARLHGVDWKLLKAIAQVESSENVNAENPADPSFGLMQILCQGSGATCTNKLNVDGWPPKNKQQLFDPDYNIHIGAQILAWNQQRYGFKRGIAVYNCWSCRTAPPDGPFKNQDYVDKVLTKFSGLGGRVG